MTAFHWGARCRSLGVAGLAGAFITSAVRVASAEPAPPLERPVVAQLAAADSTPVVAEESPVARQAGRRGFIFHPSQPALGAFRFGVGAFYDAVDPNVMYGYVVRIPQITLDARFGLGAGWSLKGHLNTMLVTNELLFGASYAWRSTRWSLEAAASVGIYVGTFRQLAFDATLLAPEYRPELSVGYDLGGGIVLSLRGSLLLMGPERARVGSIWGGLDNSSVFAGHSEMLYVENTTRSDVIWYFGLGALTTRAYYQMWLLFPDSPELFTYARVVAGCEF